MGSELRSPLPLNGSIRSSSSSLALTVPGTNLNQGTPRKAAVRSPKPTASARENPATPPKRST